MTKNNSGFTLIELLLVVVIIGVLLAVIVPRAWRANVDAKYGLVRQNATELVAFAQEWAEQNIQSSPPGSLADASRYFYTLCSPNNARVWVGRNAASNWNSNGDNPTVEHRGGIGSPLSPESSIEDIVPIERLPRNPFSGTSVFSLSNDPVTQQAIIPGALACGMSYTGGNGRYYALIFLGTDSTTSGGFPHTPDSYDYHAGMEWDDLAGLRNGIFLAQTFNSPAN